MIYSVQPGGGAAEAGLLGFRTNDLGDPVLGDIITRIDDRPVNDTDDLLRALSNYKAGDIVRVTLIRDGEEMTARVRLSAPESEFPQH